MQQSRKLIYLLWSVIVVLVLGFAVGGFIVVRHANQLDQANFELTGSNESLRRQLEQAKVTPTPSSSPSPSPSASPSPGASPSPSPSPQP